MLKIQMKELGKITFDEGYDQFIYYCKSRNLRKQTIIFYDNSMRTIYKFIEPKTPIKDITEGTVSAFIMFCKNELDVKDITINTYLRAFKTILYYFMQLGYMKEFKISLIKVDKEIIQTYSDEELKILLQKPDVKKCNFTTFRTWTCVNFLLATGCRVGSLINIKNKDVDYSNEVVYLNITKNRKPLVIPLSNTIIKVLREYQTIRKGDDEDYLFCTQFGEKVSPTTLNANIRNYNRRRGVTKTGLHRFRHTFAKNWILNQGDVFKLQKILGHSDMEVVRNYVNMFTSDLQKDFNEFNPLEKLQEPKRKGIRIK